jgi:hypothetical protein
MNRVYLNYLMVTYIDTDGKKKEPTFNVRIIDDYNEVHIKCGLTFEELYHTVNPKNVLWYIYDSRGLRDRFWNTILDSGGIQFNREWLSLRDLTFPATAIDPREVQK